MTHKFANNGTLPENLRLNQRRYDAKKKYGLTLSEVEELRKLPCEICGIKAKKMCIDHKIASTYRGILCQQCNVRLGWYEKLQEIIVNYQKKGPQNAIKEINKC